MNKTFLLNMLLFVGLVSYGQNLDIPSFGSDTTFEVITWNIEWFPKNGQSTVDYVSEIIQDLNVDLIAMQELDDTIVFNQMMASLDNYEGYFKSSWFAGLAYIYNSEVIEIDTIYEIYTTEPYWRPFPRSPMVMECTFLNDEYVVINNHFKCCGDGIMDINDPWDEETRRHDASILIEEYIRIELQNEKVILLGDLNDLLTDPPAHNVFNVYIGNEENYQFVDMNIAEGSNYNWSYPSWPSHLDHILITNELFDDFSNFGSDIQTLRLDDFFDGGFSEYDANVSDHRPVVLKIYTETYLEIGETRQTDPIVYPNPCHDKIYLMNTNNGQIRVRILNLLGQIMKEYQLTSHDDSIDVSSLNKGVFIMQIASNQTNYSIKFIKSN